MEKVTVQLSKSPKIAFTFDKQTHEDLLKIIPDGYKLHISKIRKMNLTEERKEQLRKQLDMHRRKKP